MRFTHVMPTSAPLIAVQDLIMQEHSVPSPLGLKLFLGPTTAEENMLKSDDYGLSLEQLSINGGARNDHVEQVSRGGSCRCLLKPIAVHAEHADSHSAAQPTQPSTRAWTIVRAPNPPRFEWHANVGPTQVITYEYTPFKSILNLPRGTRPRPLREG